MSSSSLRHIEFTNLPALYAHVERNWIIDVSRYSSYLLDCGPEVYKWPADAVYCSRSGRTIFVLDGFCFWKDGDEPVYLRSIQDVRNARGDIRDQYGRLRMTYKDVLRGDYDSLPPLRGRANEGARAYVGEILKEIFEVNVQGNVGQMHNVFVQSELEENQLLKSALRSIERMVLADYRDQLEEYGWHDFTAIADKSGAIILEMGMDVRIREFYETRIRDEARKQAEED